MRPFFKSCALSEAVVWRCSIKKRVLNNFTGKHQCRSLFSDKTARWRPETLLKRDFSTGLSLCIFRNTFWFELVNILLLLADIFYAVVVVGTAILNSFKVFASLTPLGRRKTVFTLSAAIFQNVCLRFYLNLIGW